jgi:hypothetical protein
MTQACPTLMKSRSWAAMNFTAFINCGNIVYLIELESDC